MSADRLRDLWSKSFLGAELSDAEKRELLDALRDDPALREEFLNDRELDGLLRSIDEAGRESDAFERSFNALLENERDGGPFIERVRERFRAGRRVARRPDRADGRIFWISAAAAAGVLIVLAVVAGSGRRDRPEPPRAQAPPETPAPAPREEVDPRPRLQGVDLRRDEPERPAPVPVPAEEGKRKDALRSLEEERRGIEVKPAPPAPPREPKGETTRPAVAVLSGAKGRIRVRAEGVEIEGRDGQDLLAGQGLEVSADGRAVVSYPDGSRLELGGGTDIRDLDVATGKRLFVAKGEVVAQVSAQPAGQPMVFATPQGEAVVLGTKLRVAVTDGSTRLEVKEGKVRLTAAHLANGVEVSAGFFAMAAPGMDLVSRPLPIDEILLLPTLSKISGGDWRRVKDTRAAAGVALDAPLPLTAADAEVRYKTRSLGYVTFEFQADAERDYAVWIRGCCMLENAELKPRFGSDMVAVETPGAEGVGRALPFCLGNNAYGFTGWGYRPGYWWVGGNADATRGIRESDDEPLTLRFARPGRQILRVYVYESPMRLDAIWLSATRKKRPADDRKGP